MKLLRGALCGGLLLLGGYAIAEAPDVQPPPQQSCQITGSQHTLDFGSRTRAQLTPNQWGKLSPGQQSVQINVTCRYPKKMVLSVVGSTAGQLFAWGDGGTLRLEIQDAVLDNQPVILRPRQGDRHTPDATPTLDVLPGIPFAPVRNEAVAPGKQLTFMLVIKPELDDGRVKLNRRYDWQSALSLRLE